MQIQWPCTVNWRGGDWGLNQMQTGVHIGSPLPFLYTSSTKSYCFSKGNIKSVAPKLFTISISIKMVFSLK